MSIGMGKIMDATEKVYAISPESPVGALLMGKRVGEQIEFRGRKIIIKQVI
jgi:transcription elongation GreA/GreB family factor